MRLSFDPINWLTGNPIIWVVLIAGVSWLSKLIRGRPKPGSPAPGAPDGEEAERTRRVQEEVRRRIAERRSRVFQSAPETAAPRPAAQNQGENLRKLIAKMAGEEPAPPALDEAKAALARQRAIEEKLRVLESEQAAALARAAQTAAVMPAPSAPAVSPAGWLGELRDPRGLRRAIVLREILGPPVGLRQSGP